MYMTAAYIALHSARQIFALQRVAHGLASEFSESKPLGNTIEAVDVGESVHSVSSVSAASRRPTLTPSLGRHLDDAQVSLQGLAA